MNYLGTRSMTFTTAGQLADTNAIKTSVATVAAATTYSGGALNGTSTVGVVSSPSTQTFERLVSWPTVTAASNAGSYVNGSTIVFTGTYNGDVTTRTATVVGTDGNATFTADGPLDLGSVTSIAVGAQTNTGGHFEFGWTDIGPRRGSAWVLFAREAGDLVVGYADSQFDTVTLPQHGSNGALVTRVYAATSIDFTAYEMAA